MRQLSTGMGLFWLLFCLSFHVAAFGVEIYYDANGDQVVVLPEESGGWSLDTFTYDQDGWPLRKSHEQFRRREVFADRLQTPLIEPFSVADLNPVQVKANHFPKIARELLSNEKDTLWPVTNQWSWDWEMAYSKWVATDFGADFFKQAGFPTVCSDVAYALRWIFARNNGLPAANRLSTGEWFTHRSMREKWKKLPTNVVWFKDQRFMAALNYLSENTYTHTLWDDSYPIAIDPTPLSPGAYHVNKDGGYGHTMIIYKVGTDPDQIPIDTLASTTPRAVRELNEYMYSEDKSPVKPLGIFRMRWPLFNGSKVSLVPPESMPWYSNEQNEPDFVKAPRTSFWEEVFYRLNPNLHYGVVAATVREQIKKSFLLRVPLVEKGLAACQRGSCRKGSSGWEDWSTVSSDLRILIRIAIFDKYVQHAENRDTLLASLDEPLLNIEGHPFTLAQAMQQWRDSKYEADPSLSLAIRWGLEPLPKPMVANAANRVRLRRVVQPRRVAQPTQSSILMTLPSILPMPAMKSIMAPENFARQTKAKSNNGRRHEL